MSGAMRSYVDAENTGRAADFITDCVCLIRWDGIPASVEFTATERETTTTSSEGLSRSSDVYGGVER